MIPKNCLATILGLSFSFLGRMISNPAYDPGNGVLREDAVQELSWMREPADSTPGTSLAFKEIGRRKEEETTAVTYDVIVSGVPRDKVYQLWAEGLAEGLTFGGDYTVQSSGRLVSNDTHEPLGDVILRAFARAEPYRMALITEDKAIAVFGKIIPFPIEARSPSGCQLSVELIDSGGESFHVEAEGFVPGEEVSVESQSLDEILPLTRTASIEGTFSFVYAPAVIGHESGRCKIKATGERCQVVVEFDWGTAAIRAH